MIVGEFEDTKLNPGFALYLGFERLNRNIPLREIVTTSTRKINIVNTARAAKLSRAEYVAASSVYYIELVEKGVNVFGARYEDFTDPDKEEEEYDEYSPFFVECLSVKLNVRYPLCSRNSEHVKVGNVKIYTNRQNNSNGVLACHGNGRYTLIADAIIEFNLGEEIIDFFSFEVGLFPDFYVRSKNFIYFINRDVLVKYNFNFDPLVFDASYFALNYKSDAAIPRNVIADVRNYIGLLGDQVSNEEDMLIYLKDRALNQEEFLEKMEQDGQLDEAVADVVGLDVDVESDAAMEFDDTDNSFVDAELLF